MKKISPDHVAAYALPKRLLRLAAASLLVLSASALAPSALTAAAPVANYDWKPVRIGAGGFVTGFSIHPLDVNVRFARTDVGNGYRWDASAQVWQPIIVRNVATANNTDVSTGLSAAIAAVPAGTGVESLVVDPSNVNIVYIAFPLFRSNDVSATHPNSSGALYKSTDGGITFAQTGLAVPMRPNGPTRASGERISVDPKNSSVVYYGSVSSGLRRSIDGATTWSLVDSGAPAADADVINVLFDPAAPTIVVGGQTRSSVVYATVIGGQVYRSADGGQSWSVISAGIDLNNSAAFTTIDRDGRLYVVRWAQGSYVNGDGSIGYYRYDTNEIWRYVAGVWTKLYIRDANGNGFGGPGTVHSLAIDPNNPQRIFATSGGAALNRSTDGGATWVPLADSYRYANTLAWLPQITANGYRANGGIVMDRNGRLWSPQGNEGVLWWQPSATDSEGPGSNPQWTIDSRGIEELVAHQIVIPPGSGDKAVVTAEDATGFFIDNPDAFTARQAIELQPGQLISNGVGLAYCPNAPSYLVISGSDINNTGSGANYSGYSTNGGRTWTPFASRPSDLQCGQIAISARGGWGLGSDHIVALPATNRPPQYTTNGGQSWQPSAGLPLNGDGTLADWGMFTFALRQQLLIADPLTPDKFYVTFINGPLYVSTDGGASWAPVGGNGLPGFRFHSQMVANRTQPGDLWFVDGWEGANPHGLYHSINGGADFTRNPTVDYALTLALGKGRGLSGDAAFTVYIQGKIAGDSDWGVFCSTDAGTSWTRVAYNPAGLFDTPSSIAASWDTFGLLYIGFGGSSFVYGRPGATQTAAPVISPRAGIYGGPLTVTMTTPTPGATLLYTTDGSDPVNGTIYGPPLSLAQSKTVKALAFRSDQIESPTTTAAYTVIPPAPVVPVGNITHEIWTNQTGTLASVPFDTAAPTTTAIRTSLEVPANTTLNNFGQRLRGYLIPAVSGNYTFWLASDDSGSLRLSPDDQPSHAVSIASVNGWTSYRQWTKYSSQRSAPVALVAGRRYYIEARAKDYTGGDHLSVAWRRDTTTPTAADIIPGSVLSPWGSPPPSTAVFHFETSAPGDTQTWVADNSLVTALATSTDRAAAGLRSLKISINKTSSFLEGGTVRVYDPQGAAGKTVTFRVWIPATITGAVELYVFTQTGSNWDWQSTGFSDPVRGGWTTLTLAVPATDDVKTLGVGLNTLAPFTSAIYLDEVTY